MTAAVKSTKSEASMSVMDAIHHRRALRDYAPRKIEQAEIRMLLDAAVQAPNAMHEEGCEFAVIQDRDLLKRPSDFVKDLAAKSADDIHRLDGGGAFGPIASPEFNAFHNAGSLIVIYGKPVGPFVAADRWQAAEMTAFAPIIVGLPTGETPVLSRKRPEILCWK